MKSIQILSTAFCLLTLISCETPPPPGGAGSFHLTEEDHARHNAREAKKAQDQAASLGQTSESYMYQENQSGPFGSRSSTGVVRSTGGVQSYQTIGSQPVYPGMPIPGYNYTPQPIYMGNPGYYWGPRTVRRY